MPAAVTRRCSRLVLAILLALPVILAGCSLDGGSGQTQTPTASTTASRPVATAGAGQSLAPTGPAGTAPGQGGTGGGPATGTAGQAALLPPAAPSPFPLPLFLGDPLDARPAPTHTLDPVTRYFTETGHYVGGEFLDFYRNTPRSQEVLGLPISEEFPQQFAEGGIYRVQYFERARMELHPELPSGHRVLLGALGSNLSRGRSFATVDPVASTSTRVFFPETGHTLSNRFLAYWQSSGGMRLFGLPISQPLDEDGMTVQYFERARFEYHEGLDGTAYAVQLSPIGYMTLVADHFKVPMGTMVRFDPPRVAEGHTTVVEVAASPGMTVTGQYEGNTLLFTNEPGKEMAWALIGATPFADVGSHPVSITLQDSTGARRTITRTLDTLSYPFPSESLQFDPETAKLLDPSLTGPELTKLNAIFAGRTPRQYWSGTFRMPLDGNVRITSYALTRRCYNCPDGSRPTTYHGGMDMAAAEGTPVHAPEGGVVVLAERLNVRGNVIIIDHGDGVFSLLAHNSKLIATVGQVVKKGDVVSLSGNTGLSIGPHLHWELHISGPAVDPLEWVNRAIP